MHEMASYQHALYHSRHDCYCYRCGCYKNCSCWYDVDFDVREHRGIAKSPTPSWDPAALRLVKEYARNMYYCRDCSTAKLKRDMCQNIECYWMHCPACCKRDTETATYHTPQDRQTNP